MAKSTERLGGYWVEFILTILLIVTFSFLIAFAVYFYKAKVYAEDNPTLNPVAPISKEAASVMMYACIFLAVITGIFVTLLIIDLVVGHKKSPLGKSKYRDQLHREMNIGKCSNLEKGTQDYNTCKKNKEIIASKDEQKCRSLFDRDNIEGYDLCEQQRDEAVFVKGYGYVGKLHKAKIDSEKNPQAKTSLVSGIQY